MGCLKHQRKWTPAYAGVTTEVALSVTIHRGTYPYGLVVDR